MMTTKTFIVSAIVIFVFTSKSYCQIADTTETEAVEIIDTEQADNTLDATEAAQAVDMTTYPSSVYNGLEMPDNELKKYHFSKGKPVLLVVNIQQSIPNDKSIAAREWQELKKNFAYLKADIQLISEKSILTFDNEESEQIAYNNYNEEYQQFIYWDGKKDGHAINKENFLQSSEFLSSILNESRESSYVSQFESEKQKVQNWINGVDNISETSYRLSNQFVHHIILQQFYHLKMIDQFIPFDFKGIKAMHVSFKKNGSPMQIGHVNFNTEGLPTISEYTDPNDREDTEAIKIKFEYENNLFKKLIVDNGDNEYTDYVAYKADTLFYIDSDNESYKRFYLHPTTKFLLFNYYFLYNDKYVILEDTLEFKNNRLSYHDFGNLNDYYFDISNTENYLPANGKLRSENNLSLNKESDKIYILKMEEFKTQILVDEKGRITKIEGVSNEDKDDDYALYFRYEYY